MKILKFKLLIAVTLGLVVNGCAIDRAVGNNVEDSSPIDLSVYQDQHPACPKVDEKAVLSCENQNGKLQRAGMMGCYSCIKEYSDAGKICQDSSECQGNCRASQNRFAPAGTKNQTGKCQSNSSPFGCFQNIEKGVLQNALCVD